MKAFGWIELYLGTRVEISAHAEAESGAHAAIEAAFTEVALIHRLMSFHQKDSDVSRLNREGARGPVTVDPLTVQVIRAACELSRLSDGLFDITVAPELVKAEQLPPPDAACVPSSSANWQDIEFVAEDAVVFQQPLWIDLGGIAKGFAVDRAFTRCLSYGVGGVKDCRINAGGDIRLSDGITGSITLDVPGADSSTATVELSGGSIASSCGWPNANERDGVLSGPHLNGVTGAPVDPTRFVSVLAEDCMTADALTKVVLILGEEALPLLSHYAATALVHDKGVGWRQIPAEL